MSKLDKVKEIIKENYVSCGLFFTRNLVGDRMATIYNEDGITVDICYGYDYFEVFGLDKKEQEELTNYYDNLDEKKC